MFLINETLIKILIHYAHMLLYVIHPTHLLYVIHYAHLLLSRERVCWESTATLWRSRRWRTRSSTTPSSRAGSRRVPRTVGPGNTWRSSGADRRGWLLPPSSTRYSPRQTRVIRIHLEQNKQTNPNPNPNPNPAAQLNKVLPRLVSYVHLEQNKQTNPNSNPNPNPNPTITLTLTLLPSSTRYSLQQIRCHTVLLERNKQG